MTATYTGDPTTDNKDELRFLVGDTDMTDPILQDEEYEWISTQTPDQTVPGQPDWLGAAAACDAIAGKFARKMQSSVSSLSSSAQQQWEHYVAMAAQYRTLYASGGTLGMQDGESSANSVLRIVPGSPILGGGGPTYLGGVPLASGGSGF